MQFFKTRATQTSSRIHQSELMAVIEKQHEGIFHLVLINHCLAVPLQIYDKFFICIAREITHFKLNLKYLIRKNAK